jgi:acetolactate synthase-1/3 small subunit
MEKLLRQYGIKEFVRTGTIGILRGSKTVTIGK